MKNFDKVKEQWKLEDTQSFDSQICDIIRKMRGIKKYQGTWECGSCKDCYKWLQQEYKQPILGDIERKYLSTVIRPFRNKVTSIYKLDFDSNEHKEYILINLKDDYINMPYFTAGTMYKGMKIDKEYTLAELGL